MWLDSPLVESATSVISFDPDSCSHWYIRIQPTPWLARPSVNCLTLVTLSYYSVKSYHLGLSLDSHVCNWVGHSICCVYTLKYTIDSPVPIPVFIENKPVFYFTKNRSYCCSPLQHRMCLAIILPRRCAFRFQMNTIICLALEGALVSHWRHGCRLLLWPLWAEVSHDKSRQATVLGCRLMAIPGHSVTITTQSSSQDNDGCILSS